MTPYCGHRWDHDPQPDGSYSGAGHTCDLDVGHEGTHICATCGWRSEWKRSTWPRTPVPLVVKADPGYAYVPKY